MTDQQKRLLRAKVSLSLLEELGRRPTPQEIERWTQTTCVLWKTVLGLHYERKAMKGGGQLALF